MVGETLHWNSLTLQWYLLMLVTNLKLRLAYGDDKSCTETYSSWLRTLHWGLLMLVTKPYTDYCSCRWQILQLTNLTLRIIYDGGTPYMETLCSPSVPFWGNTTNANLTRRVKLQKRAARVILKGNITFVCAHTANATWFFPAIIVVTSNVTQKCQRHISRLFVSGVLCFKYALRNMCYMRILIY